MAAEVGLSDGTVLKVAKSASEFIKTVQRRKDFVTIETEDGEYRINPAQVTYVRDVVRFR